MQHPPFLAVGRTCVTVRRKGPGGYNDDGDYVEATDETTLTAMGSVQPNIKWNEMMLLPEGERSKQTLKFYTSTSLRARLEGPDGYDADEFDWTDANGSTSTYQVMKVQYYQVGPLQHCKAICVRKERT